MEIMNLLNKKETAIYKNGEALGGVIYFSVKTSVETQTSQAKTLNEILSGFTQAVISNRGSYLIAIKQYSADFADFGDENFTLVFQSGDKVKTFESCKIQSVETVVDESGKLVTKSVIHSERVS